MKIKIQTMQNVKAKRNCKYAYIFCQTSSTQIIKNSILCWIEEKTNIETRTGKGIFWNFGGLQGARSGYAE